MQKPFLTAEWRKLALLNYAVNPSVLEKHLPANTELDFFNGTCYVSLVGFLFTDTKVKGVSIPFHRTFPEVNLRFYVKHRDKNGDWKRGVVFIKEIVPKSMITWVANTIYKERYQTMPMEHSWVHNDELKVTYSWNSKHQNRLTIIADNKPMPFAINSEAEFITEHYWGYTQVSQLKTTAYKVEHPRWDVYDVKEYNVQADFGELYGPEFSFLNDSEPLSVFLAEGSEIKVFDALKV